MISIRTLGTLLPLSGMLFLLVAGCTPAAKGPSSETTSTHLLRVVPVEVVVAARQRLAVVRTYAGTLEGEVQANIISKLSERVTALRAHVGETARPGQVIIALDRSGTTSQYYQAEAGYRNAEKTLQRMNSLYKEGAIALQTLDGAQTAFDVAKANFAAARSAVDLSTPIGGAVTAINVAVGDLSTPGAILATVARIDQLKITFSMNESDVVAVAPGTKVTVSSENQPGVQREGRVMQISRSADVRSRSFEIKAIFPNTADRWFKPGMFVNVSLAVTPAAATVVVPQAALLSDGTVDRLFIVRGGHAYERRVHVGITDGLVSSIIEGLNEGDSVATVGNNNLKDSIAVSVASKGNAH